MSFDVRLATGADRPELAQLIREMIPGCDADVRLAWLYDRNPGGTAMTWLASEAGEVAGVTSYFPFRLWLDQARVRGALGGDGFVRPRFRRRGLGGLLHDAARRAMTEHGIACMYGAPGAMNVTPLKHGGSREVGHVSRWARPLSGAALGIRARPFDQMIRAILRPRGGAVLDPMTRDDPRVDDVWRESASAIRLGAIRDAAFYTWRFVDSPAQRQQPYVILDRGRPVAACVLERINDHQTVRIIDLVAADRWWHVALGAIAHHAAGTRANILDIKLMTLDGRRRVMARSGFTERDSKPFLVVIPRDGDRRLLDPLRWFYSGGDSDVDTQE